METKKHWYVFSYIGIEPISKTQVHASAICGYDRIDSINIKEIKKNTYEAGLDEKAVLMSVFYLGEMTIGEVEGNNDNG